MNTFLMNTRTIRFFSLSDKKLLAFVGFYLLVKAKIAIFAHLKSHQEMSHRNYIYIFKV